MTWSDEALAYLEKHRDYVRRDLGRLRSGEIRIGKLQGAGHEDATAEWSARYERQIAHLDRIIEAHGQG